MTSATFSVVALLESTPRRPLVEVDESAARQALRDQIARMEHDLATTAVSVRPHLSVPPVAGHAGPRLLGLAELEAVRDDLADRLSELRATRSEIAEAQAAKRVLVERMLLEPGKYRFARVTGDQVGEPGCKSWEVRPRLGIIGMLAGWWHVKISSGCPLAWGPWRTPRPRTM